MKLVVCAKEVLDPDAVNSYALAGRLVIGDDGKTLTQSAIPRLINGFDEQAIEAALRIRDAGAHARSTWSRSGATPRTCCATRRRSEPTRWRRSRSTRRIRTTTWSRGFSPRTCEISGARISCSAGARPPTTTRASCPR
jgi:hypothetical protein